MKKLSLLLLLLAVMTMMVGNSQADVTSLSAGVSEEDRAPHDEFSLKVVTFVHGGSYLANITIRIRDMDRKLQVFQGVADGPWLFVALPPGNYFVTGERGNGDRQGEAVSLVAGGRQAEVGLVFPDR